MPTSQTIVRLRESHGFDLAPKSYALL